MSQLPEHCKLVTLRGPSGSGKSTTARILVRALNNVHKRFNTKNDGPNLRCSSNGSSGGVCLRGNLPETIVLSPEEMAEASSEDFKQSPPPLVQLFESDYFTEELKLRKVPAAEEITKRALAYWGTGVTKILVFEGIFNMDRPHWVEMFQNLDALLLDCKERRRSSSSTPTTSNFCWDTPEEVSVSRHSSRMKRNIFDTDEMLGWYHKPQLVSDREERRIHIDPENPEGLVSICMKIYDTLDFHDYLMPDLTGRHNLNMGSATVTSSSLPSPIELRCIVEREVQSLWSDHVALRQLKQRLDIQKRLKDLLKHFPEAERQVSAEEPPALWWVSGSLQLIKLDAGVDILAADADYCRTETHTGVIRSEIINPVVVAEDWMTPLKPRLRIQLRQETEFAENGSAITTPDDTSSPGSEKKNHFVVELLLILILPAEDKLVESSAVGHSAVQVLLHEGSNEVKAKCSYRFHVDFFKNSGV